MAHSSHPIPSGRGEKGGMLRGEDGCEGGGFGSAAFECVLSVQVCTGTGHVRKLKAGKTTTQRAIESGDF